MAQMDDTVAGSGYGNPFIDSLIWGCRWIPDPGDPVGPLQLNYHFGQAQDPFGSTFAFRAWSDREENAFRLAFQLYENVANIEFNEVQNFNDADFVEWVLPASEFDSPTILGQHEVPDPSATLPPPYGYYNATHSSWAYLQQGAYGFITIIHELGHALGLAHPHDGGDPFDEPDATIFPGVSNSGDRGDLGLNQGIWTTMSYNDGWNVLPGVYPSYGYQGTPMAFDIAALQELYGANTTYNTGDNVYVLPGKNASGTFWSCIWDAGGIDEISAEGLSGASKINLNDATLQVGDPNAGGFVSSMAGIRGGFTIANTAAIENATGGKGNDTLTGNELDNLLKGNAGADSLIGDIGADTLEGGLGSDKMQGGKGDDLYWVDAAGDTITELFGEGKDTAKSSATYALGAEIEVLELQGTLAINGTGNSIDNLLIGNSAANTLDGKAGVDTMQGGGGGDTYLVDDEDDKTDETGGNGIDTVKSAANSYTLGLDVENLTLTGAAITGLGNLLANIIIGTAAGNTLSGLAGNDSLNGGAGDDSLAGGDDNDTADGGAGADAYSGGAGNDRYKVDAGDSFAGADAGTDTIETLLSYVLGAEHENLTLAGMAAINGTGNGGKNVLTGNGGANILDGLAGDDSMVGAAGNDTYIVDSSADEVTEVDKGGTDTVKSEDSFVLSGFIEKLELTGTDNIDGTGNALANTITGNIGANRLSGLDGNDTLNAGEGNDTLDGGVGNDAMTGGIGDDVYVVGVTGDKVTEGAAAGEDTVKSSISYTLGKNVENLELTALGTKGIGNTLDNVIVGSGGNDTLDGKAGADTLRGGLGDDTYIVDLFDEVDETGGNGKDTIQIAATFDLAAPSISVLGAIENLTLMGTGAFDGGGNALGNAITGNSGANKLSGLAGNDTLDGGAGNDTMTGGADDDTYGVNSVKDVVDETGGGGTDTIRATIAIDLTLDIYKDIENVALTGTAALKATGDGEDNQLTGNDGANLLIAGIGLDTLIGGKGNDTLDGDLGAADADSLAGGLGNDTYLIDAGDDVTEAASEGTDTVRTSVTGYTLTANVENLVLLAGVASGTGNDLKNTLTGNELANTLDGWLLADTMIGGKGDDTYRVDQTKDVVTEVSGKDSGSDTVISTAAIYTLGAYVENLTLQEGAGDISGTGNTLNNILTGNSGDNTLNGGGGADTLNGGLGNDTYVYDGKDSIDDLGGFDVVQAAIAVDLTLPALDDIEGVRLTGTGAIAATGDANANLLVGNGGANKLTGNEGADTIEGGGGNDTVVGGQGDDEINVATGNDTVRYTTALDGHDVITNFDGNASGGQDVLNLDALFDSLGAATADRAGRVTVGPLVGNSVDVQVDGVAIATLNLANPADAITVGTDVVVGTL